MREQIKVSATFLLSILVALSIAETRTYVKPIFFLLSILITLKHEKRLLEVLDILIERLKKVIEKTDVIKKYWSNSN